MTEWKHLKRRWKWLSFSRRGGGGAPWKDARNVGVHNGHDLLCSLFPLCAYCTVAVADWSWPRGVRNHIKIQVIHTPILFRVAWLYLATWPRHSLPRIFLCVLTSSMCSPSLSYHSLGRPEAKPAFAELPCSAASGCGVEAAVLLWDGVQNQTRRKRGSKRGSRLLCGIVDKAPVLSAHLPSPGPFPTPVLKRATLVRLVCMPPFPFPSIFWIYLWTYILLLFCFGNFFRVVKYM